MQNKLTSWAVILLTTVALGTVAVSAQAAPTNQAWKPGAVTSAKATAAKPATRPAQPAKTTGSTRSAAKSTQPTKAAEPVKPATKPSQPVKVAEPTKPVQPVKAAEPTKPVQPIKTAEPAKPVQPVKAVEPAKPIQPIKAAEPVKPADVSLSAVQAENKRRLEEELKNTTISGKSIADFPNRSSLGNLELAPLPGINDSSIRGPLPMAASVSGKDLPSEQLLGRITPEVFQEMADLERGNTFLKLQLEKEKLKNDLEKLKATYRQQRLDEIAKREDVVRSRIQWWQEQEKLRLAIAKKQAEEEALARKITEQEATRDKVREEAMKRMAANAQAAAQSKDKKGSKKNDKPVAVSIEPMEELYTIDSIRGVSGKLTARIKSKKGGDIITIKKDDILPSGHVVKKIEKDTITVAFGDRIDKLVFRPATK